MDFTEQIRELVSLLDKNKDRVTTEEATKMALVVPVLKVLGYDITDPDEVIPEYTADYHGLKKDEKIDYVLCIDKKPKILIEVKSAGIKLPEKSSQLLKYFVAMKLKFPVRFAILTNGIQYNFFTDFDQKNIMDGSPFLSINIDKNIRDSEIIQLKKFHKEYFDDEKISVGALELKYTGVLKRFFKKQFKEPEDEFVKFLIKEAMKPFKIMATKNYIEKFAPIVLDAFRQYINEAVTDRSKILFEEAKKAEVGVTEEDLSNKEILRHRFWSQLLTLAKTRTDLHANIKPTKYDWLGRRIHGLWFNYSVGQHLSRAELWIDKGKNAEAENEEIFDKLAANKAEIEQTFGGPLEWERLDGKRACRIRKQIDLGGYLDEQSWPKVHEAMVDAMIRLHEALSPHIQYLKK